MRFGVPRRPHPVVVHVEAILALEVQAEAKAKPDLEKEQARRALAELEERASRAGLIQSYRNGDEALGRRGR